MSDSPLISVIITAFNRRQFLPRAIRSAVDQTLDRSRYEIIVVKNFEDDESDDLIRKVDAVPLLRGNESIGSFVLAALQKSRGEVLVFFDDDDEFLPEKLQRTYNVFSSTERQGGETGYYRHDRIIVGPDGAEVKEYRKRETEYIRKVGSFSVGKPLSERDANRLLLSGAYAYTSAIAIRKAAVTPFASYLPSVETSHDLFLFFCALLSQYNLYVDSARLCRYTLHDLNTSIFKYQKSKAELEDAVLKFFQKEVRTFEAIRKMQSELRSDSDPVVEKLLGYELYSRKVDLNMVDPSSSRRRVMSDATKFLTRYSFRTTRGSQLKIYVRCVLRVLFPKTAKRIFVKRFSS